MSATERFLHQRPVRGPVDHPIAKFWLALLTLFLLGVTIAAIMSMGL